MYFSSLCANFILSDISLTGWWTYELGRNSGSGSTVISPEVQWWDFSLVWTWDNPQEPGAIPPPVLLQRTGGSFGSTPLAASACVARTGFWRVTQGAMPSANTRSNYSPNPPKINSPGLEGIWIKLLARDQTPAKHDAGRVEGEICWESYMADDKDCTR